MMHRLVALVIAELCVGCLPAQPTVEECESMCVRQGKKVSAYRTGAQIPLVKPRPSVICSCE